MKKLGLVLLLTGMIVGIPFYLWATTHVDNVNVRTVWPEFDGPAGVNGEYVVTVTNLASGEVVETATYPHETGHGDYAHEWTINETDEFEIVVVGTDEYGRVDSCTDSVAYLRGWQCPGPCYTVTR